MTSHPIVSKAILLAGVALALLLVDRMLLAAEARGWIYYRRTRPVRGVSMYHLNELSQILGGNRVPEIREEVREEESGDPPVDLS